jgi:hypothetical protein
MRIGFADIRGRPAGVESGAWEAVRTQRARCLVRPGCEVLETRFGAAHPASAEAHPEPSAGRASAGAG